MSGSAPHAARPLRILLVYETLYPSTIGGIEARNAQLATALVALGHQVTVAGLGAGESPAAYQVLPVGPLGKLYTASGRRSLRHTLRFARAVARLDVSLFDVVETANQFYLHLRALDGRCRRARRPLLVTWYEHWGAYWLEYVGPLLAALARAIERRALRRGTHLLATCALTEERVRAASGRPVRRVPCGIEVERIAAARPGPGADLVYAGRLVPHKRVDLLLRAFARLRRDRPALTLDVIGSGGELAHLRGLATELGVGTGVRFRGFLPTSEELWGALAAARVAVQPSAREGFGLFPLEALAARTPVVHCRSSESAVGELVRDGVEGFAADADPEALAAALARVLDSPGERERLAVAAARRAQEFAWPKIATQFVEVCRESVADLTASAPRPPARWRSRRH